jgi:hypothetical protein
MILRSPSSVVSLEHLRAYPEGFEFRLCLRSRQLSPGFGFPGPIGPSPPGGMRRHIVLVADDNLRLGLVFADGTRLTNLSPIVGVGPDESVPQPLLVQHGGGGIGARWDQRYWVFGLPPEGPLTVVVESPARDIPESRVDLRAEDILAAAHRAETLWEEDASAPASGYLPAPIVAFAPEPRPTGRRPQDEEVARRAVEFAFTRMQEIVDDDLVNVEGGKRLAPTMRDLHQRFGGTARSAVHQVERITFVSDTQAAVWFSVWLGPSPYLPSHQGVAIIEDGRWKVSRNTLCALLARAGVPCPPA